MTTTPRETCPYPEPVRIPVAPPKRLLICERCWTVIAIDGEKNVKRGAKTCPHLGPLIHAVTTW